MNTRLERAAPVGVKRQSNCIENLNLCLSYGYTCRGQTTVGFVEILQRPRRIVSTLGERRRVPFAARDREEIATVDVDGAGEACDWVGDGVDEVATERGR